MTPYVAIATATPLLGMSNFVVSAKTGRDGTVNATPVGLVSGELLCLVIIAIVLGVAFFNARLA